MKLQTKILLLGCTILIIAIGFGGVVILNKIDKYFQTIALERNDTTMQEVIKLPALTEALMEPTPLRIEQLNYLTNIIQKSAHVDFIVVIDMNGNRLSHPNPAKIGLHVEGDDTAEVFLGKTYNSVATGTLGSSLRSFKPIHHNGGQIGAIIIGTTIKSINLMASEVYRPIAYFLIFLLSTTIGLTLYLSRNIKKILNNLEPHEIAKILEERNTIFKTVKEGIIAINASGYITLINDEAKRILNLNGKIHGNFFQQNIYPIDDYLQNSRLTEVIKSQSPEYDSEQKLDSAIIITNRIPLIVKNQVVGAMATFRDLTELRKLAEKLVGVNRYLESLRVQQHDFSNKIHVIHGLFSTQNYPTLHRYLNEIMHELNCEEEQISPLIQDHILLSFLLSKIKHAKELGIHLTFDVTQTIPAIQHQNISHALVTLFGNLMNNAFDALAHEDNKEVQLHIGIEQDNFTINITDSGPGIQDAELDMIFKKGYSSKGNGRGYGLFITLNIMNELQGTIRYQSLDEQGLSITLHIPTHKIWYT